MVEDLREQLKFKVAQKEKLIRDQYNLKDEHTEVKDDRTKDVKDERKKKAKDDKTEMKMEDYQ